MQSKKIALQKIQYFTNLVSEQFEYSLSGYNYQIVKKHLNHYFLYQQPNKEIYDEIIKAFQHFEYITGFEKMLENHTGDCGEQTLLLAMILKHIPIIDKNYIIFFVVLMDDEFDHTFLALAPRKHNDYHLRQTLNYNKMITTTLGTILCRDTFIIADPWRNLIYNGNVNDIENPLDYVGSFKISSAEFRFTNIDLCFKDLQQKFKYFLHKHPKFSNLGIYTNNTNLPSTPTIIENHEDQTQEMRSLQMKV